MIQNDNEILHQAELKNYLAENELLLPDIERERLLIQKKLVDLGLLREMDLVANNNAFFKEARKVALSRNHFGLMDVFENYTKLTRSIILIIGLICLASLFYVVDSLLY